MAKVTHFCYCIHSSFVTPCSIFDIHLLRNRSSSNEFEEFTSPHYRPECHAFVAHRHEDLNIEYRARSDECRGARGPATGQREKWQRWPKSHILLLHSFILLHSLLDIRYSLRNRSSSNDFEKFTTPGQGWAGENPEICTFSGMWSVMPLFRIAMWI